MRWWHWYHTCKYEALVQMKRAAMTILQLVSLIMIIIISSSASSIDESVTFCITSFYWRWCPQRKNGIEMARVGDVVLCCFGNSRFYSHIRRALNVRFVKARFFFSCCCVTCDVTVWRLEGCLAHI
jgi:hypothetical protein